MDEDNAIIANNEITADLLKKLFRDFKVKQLGKPYKPAKRFLIRELWLNAADLCNNEKADPYDYVRAAFLFCDVPGGPFPQMLANGAGVKWYKQYRRQQTDKGRPSPELLFQDEIGKLIKSVMNQMFASKKRMETFLLDEYALPEHSTPAFVRVVLLPSPALIKKFGRKARAEIHGNQQLLNVMKDLGYNLSWLEAMS